MDCKENVRRVKSDLQKLQLGFDHLIILLIHFIRIVFEQASLLLFELQISLHLLRLKLQSYGLVFFADLRFQDTAPFGLSIVLRMAEVVCISGALSHWAGFRALFSFLGQIPYLLQISQSFISYLLDSLLVLVLFHLLLSLFLNLTLQYLFSVFSLPLVYLRSEVLPDMF